MRFLQFINEFFLKILLHYLLAGDFPRALYFNWLAFPIAAVCALAATVFVIELATERRIFPKQIEIRMSPYRLGGGIAVLLLVWLVQVYLAISQHKTELLNPSGPLYALFVR